MGNSVTVKISNVNDILPMIQELKNRNIVGYTLYYQPKYYSRDRSEYVSATVEFIFNGPSSEENAVYYTLRWN